MDVLIFRYAWSGLIVVAGIYLNLYSKRHPLSMTDLEVKMEYCVRYFKSKLFPTYYKRSYNIMAEV